MIKDGIKQNGFYLRPELGNPTFDFLISNYEKGELTIYLIDTTLHRDLSFWKRGSVGGISPGQQNPLFLGVP
jgi:hypothetical protein